jgi:hypothetical protein
LKIENGKLIMTACWLVGYLVPPLIGEVRKGLLTSQLV